MSFRRNFRSRGGGTYNQDDPWSSFKRNGFSQKNRNISVDMNVNRNVGYNGSHDFFGKFSVQNYYNANSSYFPYSTPSYKRRKFCAGSWGDGGRYHPQQLDVHENGAFSAYNNEVLPPSRSNAEASTSMNGKRDCSQLEDEKPVFMSRDEIDRYSPSRRDGIDALHETHLRYSYCAFLQNLGGRLDLPQTTTGTAMVLCHRFFVRRSHACHDRYLIATATLFLAAKSEETPRPLNDVLRASCEIFHKQDSSFLSYVLPVDWFEKYRDQIIEAEQMILTTLNFELNVQHPYAPLTSILDKLGLSQSLLVNLALNLINEGVYTRLACWAV